MTASWQQQTEDYRTEMRLEASVEEFLAYVERQRQAWEARQDAIVDAARQRGELPADEREAYRREHGLCDERGHLLPKYREQAVQEYLAGGVTLRQLGVRYGLSAARIGYLVRRERHRMQTEAIL